MQEVNLHTYHNCGLSITNYTAEPESREYDACRFEIDGHWAIGRTAKQTPKKVGQFVTCWKRNNFGITQPYSELDDFHFFIINAKHNNRLGQFVFPKSILIAKGIVSTAKKDGKRGFRVYPIWDFPTSNIALKTQQWQLAYFYEMDKKTDFDTVKKLFNEYK
ncbi:MepB family protein [Aequorivita sp. SDUM287046]|uniref:MepB family protein n=1 Tax=Aequorivita aurantiaca TaxID=3053356 RepID=A0ABT8DH18_9FLAO|nr:MepB family protein [Aequorivita aurantiaca]MDN3724696.1 MepB family protein [Aequorivita aurantiaca]